MSKKTDFRAETARPTDPSARKKRSNGSARAVRLARTSAARLQRAAARAGGEDGLALACALVDMIVARVPPFTWPLSEMIELLEHSQAPRDHQTDRLLETLRRIEAEVSPEDPDQNIEDRERVLDRRAA